ncbi:MULTISPECIES: hypothetical protein [Rhizobium]|uniref:Uncharacterized protein n=1 Tax=Rhizobium esperanzae TaxID=1967781 RepID=A0A7W6UTI2_9HYPH|nr:MULTISPECIES: hypothetical protein [Rhizobium]MBB4444102.1 hypothetical protein [Rhizobium esperanzae]MDH6206702.1 hypothetical protein [Rhizobium leguminosarum]
MVAKKNEEVSASYHYLLRLRKNEKKQAIVIPFSPADFDALFAKMKAQKPFDLTSEADIDRLRFREEAPLENIERANSRTITGTFKASYWGHAFDNTHKGRISSQSVNLRPFHFVLYLSESGRIYIGAQYLGQYGGYDYLRKTIVDMLPEGKEVTSNSIMLGASYYRNAEPREIRVNIANKASSIAGRSRLGGKMMVAFTRASKTDPLVNRVKTSIIPFFGRGQSEIKHAVAGLINQSDVIAINDEDVIDCTVVADMNGKTTTIHMFENGFRATRVTLDVRVDDEGHPQNAETCNEILNTLNDHVIIVTENG